MAGIDTGQGNSLDNISARVGLLLQNNAITLDEAADLLLQAEKDLETYSRLNPGATDFEVRYLAGNTPGLSFDARVQETTGKRIAAEERAQDSEQAKVTKAIADNFDRDYDTTVLQPLRNTVATATDADVRAQARVTLTQLQNLKEQNRANFYQYMAAESGGDPLTLKDAQQTSAIAWLYWNRDDIFQAARPDLSLDGFEGTTFRDNYEESARQVFTQHAQEQQALDEFDRSMTGSGGAIARLDALIASPNTSASKRQLYLSMRRSLGAAAPDLGRRFLEARQLDPTLDAATFLNEHGTPYLRQGVAGNAEAGSLVVEGDFFGSLGAVQEYESPEDKAAADVKAKQEERATKLKAIADNPIDPATGRPVYSPSQVEKAKADLTGQSMQQDAGFGDVLDEDPAGDLPLGAEDSFRTLMQSYQFTGPDGKQLAGTPTFQNFAREIRQSARALVGRIDPAGRTPQAEQSALRQAFEQAISNLEGRLQTSGLSRTTPGQPPPAIPPATEPPAPVVAGATSSNGAAPPAPQPSAPTSFDVGGEQMTPEQVAAKNQDLRAQQTLEADKGAQRKATELDEEARKRRQQGL